MADPTHPEIRLDEGALRQALAAANLPSVLMVLHHLTGDDVWLEEPFRPGRPVGVDPYDSGGFSEGVKARIVDAATTAILAWEAGAAPVVRNPSPQRLQRMMSTAFSEEVPAEYEPMFRQQMGFASGERQNEPIDVPDGFVVAIIGAGVGGMLAALRLRDVGVRSVTFEKQDGVGGVWRRNRYPGAGVDTPSHLYSYGFYHRDWSGYFARQPEVLEYLDDFATDNGLREDIRVGCEVLKARYVETDSRWELTIRENGAESTFVADAVISAVGLFAVPNLPPIPGLEEFTGAVVHSAEWSDDLNVKDKRVALVGTGASGMQVLPAIRALAKRVDVYQRTPQWVAPASNYFESVSAGAQILLSEIPFYREWYRARLAWTFNDKVYPVMRVDPEWTDSSRSVNAQNDRQRRFLTKYIEGELEGREDLLSKSIPQYPPYGKRLLLDNGWYESLRRPNVHLYDQRVVSVTGSAVVTADGEERETDIIVLGTGFDTARYLATVPVYGRNGAHLQDVWKGDDARAYLGIMTPGFPNLFFVYGPGTNAGGGSYVALAESQVGYIVGLLRAMAETGSATAEVRQDITDEYNARMDAANAGMVWSHPGMGTYVRNSAGRVTVNMPWRIVDYWRMTSAPDLAAYHLSADAIRHG